MIKMPVSIIDMNSSNSKTFLALLYQTLIYYTNDPISRGKLVYYWEPEVERRIQEEIDLMRSTGSYPYNSPSLNKEYGFLLGFKPSSFEKFAMKIGKSPFKGDSFKDYFCLEIKVSNLSGEGIANSYSSSIQSEHIQRIFDNNVAILPIDCSKFSMKSHGEATEEQKDYDSKFARFTSSYIRHRLKNISHIKNFDPTLYPIIILNNLDKLVPPLLQKHGLDKTMKIDERVVGDNLVEQLKDINYYHSGRNTRDLQRTATKHSIDLMRNHMPETLSVLNGSELKKINSGKNLTRYFLSWTVNLRKGEELNYRTMRLRYSNGSTYESTIYSRHMYISLVEHLREIAKISPDNKPQFPSF